MNIELGALRTAYRQDKAALTDALRTPASSTRGIRSVLQKLSRLPDQHLCAIRAASGLPAEVALVAYTHLRAHDPAADRVWRGGGC